MRQLEIPGRVAIVAGNGGLPKIVATTKSSAAEIYLHGAHVAHFQKTGEAPLIFMSRKSWFENGKPIRGGIPICYPWFGNRDGEPSHGFARISEWRLIKTSANENSVTLKFALPKISGDPIWNNLRTELVVTVSDNLTLELISTNESCGEIEFENCLHTYFQIGDIGAISISGLQNAAYFDNAIGGNGERKIQNETELKIARDVNRIYFDNANVVEIRDEKLRRQIRVEKSGSNSTVVWNPWTTQKLPDDFDPAEHARMVCVESGNVKQNKISLPPNQTSDLKVVISSQSF